MKMQRSDQHEREKKKKPGERGKMEKKRRKTAPLNGPTAACVSVYVGA
jgi:hypothetical protein